MSAFTGGTGKYASFEQPGEVSRLIRVPEALRHGPFTVADAEACGVRRQRLCRPNFTRLASGVYVWSGRTADANAELVALLRCLPPGSAFSGVTAAQIRGLDLVPGAPPEVTVPSPAGPRTGRTHLVRRGVLAPADVVEVDGLPLTSVARTWFDLARQQPLVEAVAAVDWALHHRLVTKSVLSAYVATRGGLKGVRQVRKVLDYAEAKSESLMESRMRMLLVLGGLPRPEAQVEIREPQGSLSARLDLYYPDAKLGIEFDGNHHRLALVEDNRRQNSLLARFGIRLLRYTSSDVYGRPGAVIAEVKRTLAHKSSLIAG